MENYTYTPFFQASMDIFMITWKYVLRWSHNTYFKKRRHEAQSLLGKPCPIQENSVSSLAFFHRDGETETAVSNSMDRIFSTGRD